MRDIQKKRKRLKVLNEGSRSEREVQERRKVVKYIAELLRQEESFWKQRFRVLWLRDADRNTKIFHQKASQRKEKNHIFNLVNERGRVGRVSEEMNEGLREDYREEEVIEELNQMHPLKAPSIDGINGMNVTNIVLIPKKKAPDKMQDFRPFSLCNVVYKLVSKNARSNGGHMALKLDMPKAYDIVEWCFLESVLTHMGFEVAWVNQVVACVTSVSYKVSTNGELNVGVECIIFTRAKESEATAIRDILRDYELASGQQVSLDKTTVSFSRGTSLERRQRVTGRVECEGGG
ncbi:uncharacterized protein LOC141594808 [Silene latifolia]|uniref:uncharacterized protein LOC141594808 n=1 Tax=Silene latifolia TaxID=37657 RepID=UPI003D77185E